MCIFYNQDRLHGSQGNMRPNRFVEQWTDNQRKSDTELVSEETIANQLAVPVQGVEPLGNTILIHSLL